MIRLESRMTSKINMVSLNRIDFIFRLANRSGLSEIFNKNIMSYLNRHPFQLLSGA
jgi:hypothetical protein